MFPERAIVLDTESTGFSPASGDRMIEIAAIEIVHGTITGNTMYGVFWPQRSVPDRAAEVHGWTTAKLRGKPLFSTVAQQFADFFEGAELWAHNAPFDNRLDAEMAKAGVRRSYALSCSMRLAKRQLPSCARTRWRIWPPGPATNGPVMPTPRWPTPKPSRACS